ncbi:MAG: Ig-like domain-containing protein [Chloroflexota bacterium]
MSPELVEGRLENLFLDIYNSEILNSKTLTGLTGTNQVINSQAINGQVSNSQASAQLTIGTSLVMTPTSTVIVPVELTTNSHSISAASFSIDYDERCLALMDQSSSDIRVDGVRPHWPSSITSFILFDATDSDGELDMILVRFSGSLLTEGLLLELEFKLLCEPLPASDQVAFVNFATNSPPSMGDPTAQEVPVVAQNGAVRIMANGTPLPNASPTVISVTPAAIVTPTLTSAVTPTMTATPEPSGTITATVTATATAPAPEETPADDGEADSGGTMTVPPTPLPNRRPIGNPDVVLLREDSTVTIHVTSNDRDPNEGDIETVAIISQPQHGVAQLETELGAEGYIGYTPDANFYGLDAFVYEVRNSQGQSAISQAMLIVLPVDDAPIFHSPIGDRHSFVGEWIRLSVHVTDPDTDSGHLTFEATNLPPGLTMDARRGTIHGVITIDSLPTYPATYAAAIAVFDGQQKSTEQFTWTVDQRPTGAGSTTLLYLPISFMPLQ